MTKAKEKAKEKEKEKESEDIEAETKDNNGLSEKPTSKPTVIPKHDFYRG